MRAWLAMLLMAVLGSCAREEPQTVAPLYDTAPVETRPIQVSVEAAGVIEPEITVEVKSKASGEILAVHADTGDVVEAGSLLVEVDQRTPRNTLAEAEASLVAARARRTIAETQMERSRTLFGTGTLTETDYEQAQLEFANSEAQVIGAEVALENARIAMDDTEVRAPIAGTIIERQVEPGTVISSPTRDVSGGTVLLRMADLTTVRVRTLVDETDIGKIRPGMSTRVTVAAYPNQPFDGEVLKIEPQAIVEQNVTMFAVLIRLGNPGGLLKPGMNAGVEIQIAGRDSVAAVPTMALRADTDIPAVALMLGLPEAQLRVLLGRAPASKPGIDAGSGTGEEQRPAAPGGAGPRVPQAGERGARPRRAAGTDYQFGGEYWVVALRGGKPVPVPVRTGITDLEYSEILGGLEPDDRVMLLPSRSLFEQQEALQRFIADRFSSSPFQQQQGGRFR